MRQMQPFITFYYLLSVLVSMLYKTVLITSKAIMMAFKGIISVFEDVKVGSEMGFVFT
jgi:hypothetical protein